MNKRLLQTVCLCMLFITVAEANTRSPYINRVYDFVPAPGQFVNKMPEYEDGDTKEDILLKVEELIAGDEKGMISLGGYGGYVVFGFDHMIVNVPGEYDFKVWGNAFYSATNPNPEAPRQGGSCEPGIVMVSYDANGNGIPDDEWYELAGSEYDKLETIKNYEITYYKPDENKVRTPDNSYKYLNDTTYVKWTSNRNDYGYVSRNIYHSQSYYPSWITDETLVFEGTKLADNYIDESGKGALYVLYAYDWGYADNHPNDNEKSNLNIEWAVDKSGNKVNLPGIHFVKVYTGVNQYCGWLGETSTEIMGAEDLHVNAESGNSIENSYESRSIALLNNPVTDQLIISSPEKQEAQIYNIWGHNIMPISLETGTNYINCNHLPKGLYFLIAKNNKIKFLKK